MNREKKRIPSAPMPSSVSTWITANSAAVASQRCFWRHQERRLLPTRKMHSRSMPPPKAVDKKMGNLSLFD